MNDETVNRAGAEVTAGLQEKHHYIDIGPAHHQDEWDELGRDAVRLLLTAGWTLTPPQETP